MTEDGGSVSVFASSLRCQEEALRMHRDTDAKLLLSKRKILLQILKRIRADPPPFLSQPGGDYSIEELDKVIADFERLIGSKPTPRLFSVKRP
jgi:hypothetical protein